MQPNFGMMPQNSKLNIYNMDADAFRKKVLDPCESNLQKIAMTHPEVMEQLAQQYDRDKREYGRLPTFISLTTPNGTVNTTIRYSDFLRFYDLFKQRPDLVDTTMAANLAKKTQIPLKNNAVKASDIWGEPPIRKR